MSELSLEQIKAKELEREKLAIMAPLIQHLHLRKEEVNGLLTLNKRQLKNLNAKVEERFTSNRHQSKIVDPKRPASLLWAIAKSAVSPNERIVMNKTYTIRMAGGQVQGCFSVAKQLYALAAEKEEEGKGETKQ